MIISRAQLHTVAIVTRNKQCLTIYIDNPPEIRDNPTLLPIGFMTTLQDAWVHGGHTRHAPLLSRVLRKNKGKATFMLTLKVSCCYETGEFRTELLDPNGPGFVLQGLNGRKPNKKLAKILEGAKVIAFSLKAHA